MSLQEPHIQGDVELQIQVINALIEFANVIPWYCVFRLPRIPLILIVILTVSLKVDPFTR